MPLKPSGENDDKWVCASCLKCSNCEKELRKNEIAHLRKLHSYEEILCLECFGQRKKGSYCPVCYKIYGDEDWDLSMMQCDKCDRWIHAHCELIDDERYSILSTLPECIGYTCRLCVPALMSNEIGWRLAIEAQLEEGCNKILEQFQKKVVGMTRKRRALSFDAAMLGDNPYFTPGENESHEVIPSSTNSEETLLIKCETEPEPEAPQSPSPSLLSPQETSLLKQFSITPCKIELVHVQLNASPKPIEVQLCSKTAAGKLLELSEDANNCGKLRTKNGLTSLLAEAVLFAEEKKNRKSTLKECRVLRSRRTIKFKEEEEILPRTCCDETEFFTAKQEEIPEILTPKIEPLEEMETEEIPPQKSWTDLFIPVNPYRTPEKKRRISDDVLTPVKISTPHRVALSFTDAVKSASWTGVKAFRSIALKLLPFHFDEITKSGKYLDNSVDGDAKLVQHFDETLKQVFPWWREDIKDVVIKRKDFNDNDEQSEDLEENKSVSSKGMGTEELPDSIVFEQVFWNVKQFFDLRRCVLCGEVGDFPLQSAGRLLPLPADCVTENEEWIHVNCAIWSSEVYEEEDGSLNSVPNAVMRSKKTTCSHCNLTGATLNCCAAACRPYLTYHFLCALEAGCVLLTDKSVFCPKHSSNVKGEVQKEMHVTRKVFISCAAVKRKDLLSKRVLSNKVKVFIGSTRVDNLGRLVPISTVSSSSLKPINISVSVLTLVVGEVRKYLVKGWRTVLQNPGDFRSNPNLPLNRLSPSEFSVTIDHGKRKDVQEIRRKQIEAFLTWTGRVDKFVDEFLFEWAPAYKAPVPTNSSKTRKRKQKKEMEVIEEENEEFLLQGITNCSLVKWVPCNGNCKALEMEDDTFLLEKLSHPRLRFLLEQLPGNENILETYSFKYFTRPEDFPAIPNRSGCYRTEGYCKSSRKPYDMFSWLRSKYRKPPRLDFIPANELESSRAKGLPIAMRFRGLKDRVKKELIVLPSLIHGRGLFAKRDIEVGQLLIEYAGEMIRASLCDIRERKYEDRGIGCYMFRVNRDWVVDATMKGNAARFINHSCEPNCESKVHRIQGMDHILIFAMKSIGRGEELVYDYKFERENDKLPCSCGSKKCRKFLN